MISAAGVRYIVAILKISRFQQCTVRVLQTRKNPAMCQPKPNVQYYIQDPPSPSTRDVGRSRIETPRGVSHSTHHSKLSQGFQGLLQIVSSAKTTMTLT